MTQSLSRILYLEDDPSLSELAMIGFSAYPDVEVLHYESGKEAIAAAPEFQPELCLFDVMLPEMDGPTAFGLVKQAIDKDALPVIFMTAKAQQHEVDQYMALGALGVIRKPFNPLAIVDQIETMWSRC